MLKLEGAGGIAVPYHGYAEVNIKIPQINWYYKEDLMLVLPGTLYSNRVLVQIVTTIIDRAMNLITPHELAEASETRKYEYGSHKAGCYQWWHFWCYLSPKDIGHH